MKINSGNIGFHVAFRVPNQHTERMETFLETHESFMRETHHLRVMSSPSCFVTLS